MEYITGKSVMVDLGSIIADCVLVIDNNELKAHSLDADILIPIDFAVSVRDTTGLELVARTSTQWLNYRRITENYAKGINYVYQRC